MQTRAGREWLDTPPVPDQASETLTMGPAHLVLDGHDADGDALSVIVVDAPVSGTLTRLDGTPIADRVDVGEVIYAPRAGFVGTDHFSFVLDDGTLRSEVAHRHVRVYEQPAAVVVVEPEVAPVTGLRREQRTAVEVTVEMLRRHQAAAEAMEVPSSEPLLPPIVTNADLEAGRGR
jgi:hypothetical protein